MDSMSRSTPVPLCYDDETPEESGWTMYFEDFSNDHNNGNMISCSSSDINYQTSSLVSGKHDVVGASLDHRSIKKNRLSFKKRKTNGSSAGFVDDDLEDTASSPVNSPKMCNMENQFGKNLKMKDVMDMSQKEKGSGSLGEMVDGKIGGENEETQLKKRGLCLVPLSMVLQYLG